MKKPAYAPGFTLRWAARAIVVLWCAFWIYFNIGSGIVEAGGLGWRSAAGHFALAAVILAAAVVSWFFEGIGGMLLVLLALALSYFYVIPAGFFTRNGMFLLLTLVLPALVAGLMLAYRRAKS